MLMQWVVTQHVDASHRTHLNSSKSTTSTDTPNPEWRRDSVRAMSKPTIEEAVHLAEYGVRLVLDTYYTREDVELLVKAAVKSSGHIEVPASKFTFDEQLRFASLGKTQVTIDTTR